MSDVRHGTGPNGAHACPQCNNWCVCAEWYDGLPCEHCPQPVAEKELLIADFAAFTPTGPTVLFIRPRHPLTPDEQYSGLEFMRHMKWPPGVQCVWLQDDFDVFALGEAQMTKLGWTRIPEATPV